MAWEQLYKPFPTGMTEFNETGLTSIADLQNSDFGVVTRTRATAARDMTTSTFLEVFGKDGEFAVVEQYNVYNSMSHPDPDHMPLNVYGMSMVNDYLTYHDVDFNFKVPSED